MGWRTTAHNLNLNRDYMKADAPEMQAMLTLLRAWDPIVYMDLHVTDGAQFQHDVAVMVDPALSGPEPLGESARQLKRNVIERLQKTGHKPVDFYPSFEKEDDPSSGFAVGVAPPRFSQAYWALHNRIGILVETHSWKDYRARVKSTRVVVASVLEEAKVHLAEWERAAKDLDNRRSASVVLDWDNTDEVKTIDFLGYAYRREPSAVSGTLRVNYDEKKPEVWKVPLKSGVKPALTVDLPRGGYYVPPAHAPWVREKLDLHGVVFRTLDKKTLITGQVFRADDVKHSDRPYEGRQTLKVKGAWMKETREFERGGLFVPSDQRLARLACHLFEPLAPDSFLAWGFFNASFEQKEYMEPYVAEAVAEEMLKDPRVKAEFAAKLEGDLEFGKDPMKRLEFFYRRHPSWDRDKDVYPVWRLDAAP